MRNKKHHRIIIPLLLLFTTMQLFAQDSNNTFKAYAKFISKVYDITWKKPKSFIDAKHSETWGIQTKDMKIGFSYTPILQSKNGDCIIMYPNATLFDPKMHILEASLPRNQMTHELKAALGIDYKKEESVSPNLNQYITIMNDRNSQKFFNADTVFIVQLPLKEPYMEKFSYCTAIYIQKKGRPSMFLKFFFTKDGKSNESRYLKKIYGKIWYRNKNWIYNDDLFLKENYKLRFNS